MEGLKKQGLEDSEAREFIEEFNVLKASKRTVLELADLLIAAQAKENNFVIVTKDDDFKKIDVRIEFME